LGLLTEGDHDRPIAARLSKTCPICGSSLTKQCKRLDGTGVVRCSGGHVIAASALEMF